ncbi:extracellular solute-binding protein [Paenibacillus sp. HB172176]|uniref:extracellular solute-binding protein n=1 Tax=Paenibacillus sp. HB172176 TaxID=2493690 RepID=UPI00143A640C|nr:extracellular solute-binding protein [Paenibacillus sp. HB172176]
MNLKKNALSTSIAILLIIALLAACGGNNNNNGNGSNTGNGNASSPGTNANNEKKVINLEMVMNTSGATLPDNDFIKTKLKEVLGVNLTITPESQLMEKLNVRAAGNNLPDLITFATANDFREYAKRGLLADLTPYKDKLDKVQDFLGDEGFTKATVDGKVYGVAKAAPVRAFSYWIRQDWLDHLGLSMPKTLDEFYNVLLAFTKDDPDGNGKDDTYGLTGTFGGLHAFTPILATFGAASEYQIRDGELVNFYEDPQLKESLKYMKKLADAKVLDPELPTNTGQQYFDKVYQGSAGVVFSKWTEMTKDDKVEAYKTANPNAEWTIIPPFEDHVYGAAVDAENIGGSSGYVAVSKAAGSNEEKMSRIVDLFNYVSYGEGLNMVQYGLEGVHYTLDGDKVTLTDKSGEAGFTWIYQLMGRPEKEYLSTKFAKQAEWIEKTADAPKIPVYDGYLTRLEGVNYSDKDRFISEELLKFVYGKRDIEEFDQFTQSLKDMFKLDEEVEQSKQTLKEQGLLK